MGAISKEVQEHINVFESAQTELYGYVKFKVRAEAGYYYVDALTKPGVFGDRSRVLDDKEREEVKTQLVIRTTIKNYTKVEIIQYLKKWVKEHPVPVEEVV